MYFDVFQQAGTCDSNSASASNALIGYRFFCKPTDYRAQSSGHQDIVYAIQLI